MITKMLQIGERIGEYLLSKKSIRKGFFWCLEHIKTKLKYSILHDPTFITFGYEFFNHDPKSDGAIVFLKRRWSLGWLLSPKGWSHVAVWDYSSQTFKDSYFMSNRSVPFVVMLREYNEILVYRTKEGFSAKFISAMTLNKLGRLYCTGLLECANTFIYPTIFDFGPLTNPSPWSLIKKINKRRFPTFHMRFMKS